MTLELFDREMVRPVPAGPLVRVDDAGQLLFNQECWGFLAEAGSHGPSGEVALWCDDLERRIGIQPSPDVDVPASARWRPRMFRSHVWPRGVAAPDFVKFYGIRPGVYQAQLHQGPGPRMVLFDPALKAREVVRLSVVPSPSGSPACVPAFSDDTVEVLNNRP